MGLLFVGLRWLVVGILLLRLVGGWVDWVGVCLYFGFWFLNVLV